MASLELSTLNSGTLDVNPYALGKAVGDWGSHDQASFLHGLSDGLQTGAGTAARFQVEYIIQQLDGRADFLLELLAEHANARATEKQPDVVFPAPIVPVEWRDPAPRTLEWANAHRVDPQPVAEVAPLLSEEMAAAVRANACPHGCGWDHVNHVPLAKTLDTTTEEAGK